MKKALKILKEFPQLIYVGLIAVLGLLFVSNKRRADIAERSNEIKDTEKDIAVSKEKLKHEEDKADDALDSYRDAKSKYDKLKRGK